MKSSIRTQIMTAFVAILTLTMVLCIGLNNGLLKDFYYQKKQEKVVHYYQKLDQLTNNKSENDSKVSAVLISMRDADNISFIQTTSDWSLDEVSANCVSNMQASELRHRLMQYILVWDRMDTVTTLKQGERYKILKYYDPIEGTSYMDCYGSLSNGTFFLMSTPLEAVQDSAQISNQFFMFTCLGGMLLALIVISVISNRLTRPLLQLAEIADHMANLDFTSKYTGDLNNEIGLLGNSMNSMSEQLESTINQLQTANEQLKKDIDEKIQIDEVRKEFLSNVSHELKTPIALIQGYAEGLQEGISDDPESRAFYCDVIVDEAKKMNRMVRKLLTLNHLEFGQDALTEEPFDICEMLTTLLNSSALEMQKKEIKVIKQYPASCMVIGDEFKIEEVCTNYISNAMNHVNGDMRICVTLEDQKDTVKITVANTGDPIPEDSLDKVWIKFYKVDKARTREYGGSGIGLSIVKAIMDAHKQPFGVYNTAEGVAFWFCLKKAPKEETDVQENENDTGSME